MSVWETLSSRFLWQSRWYNLRQDHIRTQDGHEFTYTIVDHPGAVWVVPITADGHVILIRHYRYTVDDWCWEVPAGEYEWIRLKGRGDMSSSKSNVLSIGRILTSSSHSTFFSEPSSITVSCPGREDFSIEPK